MKRKLAKDFQETASIILVAGRGSRMEGFNGNKTLLPLIPGESPYKGSQPILLHIIENLPSGPKALIVHYKKDDIIKATGGLGLYYCEQPELNGTGGALLAAEDFLTAQNCEHVIVTMGDVPFVKKKTYLRLIERLEEYGLMVLGFCPKDKRQYGVLEINRGNVQRIIEWKYWKDYSIAKQNELKVCNSGIYTARKQDLLRYMTVLASRPQIVHKEINGKAVALEEFFITDLIEYMVADGLSVGYLVAEDENETMGIDDLPALKKAQELFLNKNKNPSPEYD